MATYNSVDIPIPFTSDDVRAGTITHTYAGGSVRVLFSEGVAAAPDPAAPTITIEGPDPDADVGAGGFSSDLTEAQQTPIVIRIAGDGDFPLFAVVVVRYPGENVERVAYRRGSFRRGFSLRSSQEVDGDDLVLSILPDGGWPESGDEADIVIDVDGVSGSVSDIAGSS